MTSRIEFERLVDAVLMAIAASAGDPIAAAESAVMAAYSGSVGAWLDAALLPVAAAGGEAVASEIIACGGELGRRIGRLLVTQTVATIALLGLSQDDRSDADRLRQLLDTLAPEGVAR